ncbi:MAG TPA: Holliday junction branch migration protein RuvA [Gemmatimonadaceae bacterium]|nr:Holliday junction branch migration protein RuvA [Gemmatimonadaceae bacterium]
MIAQLSGRLVAKELDRVEVATSGGVGYELSIPLSVYESLPKVGDDVTLHTHLVVKEDGWQLFGFGSPFDRLIFRRVLGAKGVGPALALNLLSTLSGERLVRAIREHDVATLQSVPRVGRKKAEQMILDLADKLDDVQVDSTRGAGGPRPEGAATEDAIRALTSLGYNRDQAERAVRKALDEGGGRGVGAAELIRIALKFAGGG